MKITLEEYVKAKALVETHKERLAKAQTTVKAWDDAARQYGKPRDGDEIVAFTIDDGNVVATTRKVPVVKAAAS